MRISDWSSDVGSSDLLRNVCPFDLIDDEHMRPRFRYRALRIGIDHDRLQGIPVDPVGDQPVGGLLPEVRSIKEFPRCALVVAPDPFDSAPVRVDPGRGTKIIQIRRAHCREKVFPYVMHYWVA